MQDNITACLPGMAVEFPMHAGDVCPDMFEMRPCSFTIGTVNNINLV